MEIKDKILVTAAASAAIAISLGMALSTSAHATEDSESIVTSTQMNNINNNGNSAHDMEKCYGIAKKGQNDCATGQHTCQGQSTLDNSATDWIYLPAGSCYKIVGGTTNSN